MRGLGTIYRRELTGLFLSPLAWVLLCAALIFDAFFFLTILEGTGGRVDSSLGVMQGGGLPFWILLVVLPPLLTMRMISEESRSGMLEFLLTAPVSDGALVLGKALAATSFLAVVHAAVPLYALALQILGAPPDWGLVFTGWVGAVLVSALFVAIGLVSSAASGTPLLAAFLAFVSNIVIVFLPIGLVRLRDSAPATIDWLMARMGVVANLQGSFQRGVIDSAHGVFFLAWTAALLFLATRVVEARRWAR